VPADGLYRIGQVRLTSGQSTTVIAAELRTAILDGVDQVGPVVTTSGHVPNMPDEVAAEGRATRGSVSGSSGSARTAPSPRDLRDAAVRAWSRGLATARRVAQSAIIVWRVTGTPQSHQSPGAAGRSRCGPRRLNRWSDRAWPWPTGGGAGSTLWDAGPRSVAWFVARNPVKTRG
jgi:hypothetical protein